MYLPDLVSAMLQLGAHWLVIQDESLTFKLNNEQPQQESIQHNQTEWI